MPAPTAFITPADLSLSETEELLQLAIELKKNPFRKDLINKTLGMIFFNPSLRTRTSFELAMQQLGGNAITLDVGENTWNLEYRDDIVMDGPNAEHVKEAAKVLSRYFNALAIRAFPKYSENWNQQKSDPVLSAFVKHSDVPIINMESALYHPAQSLADVMTLKEKMGNLRGEPIVISWGWHVNPLPMAVTNSILVEAAKFGMDIRLAHPEGYDLDESVTGKAEQLASAAGGSLKRYEHFEDALPGARAVVFKSWGSISNYGHPDVERGEALAHKRNWQLRLDHMKKTDNGHFLHCLPVRRGVEVMDEVLDSPYSVAIDEAENRLHVQKALLLRMLG